MSENSETWFAIVNPTSGHGRGQNAWPLISRLLERKGIVPDHVFTRYRHHATELTAKVVVDGYRKIMIVGGDGTIHEVVNGLFIQKTVPTTSVVLAVIPTGENPGKMIHGRIPPNYTEAIHAICQGRTALLDCCRVVFYDAYYKQERYAVSNIAAGFDPFATRRYNRLKEENKRLHLHHLFAAFKSVLRYRSSGTRIWVDDQLVVNDLSYGMVMRLNETSSQPCQEGALSLARIGHMSKLRALQGLKLLRNGAIYLIKNTNTWRGNRITVDSSPDTGISADGEILGFTPAEFTVIPHSVRFIVNED